MFPIKVETRILLNCPHCRFSSRYDTSFLEDAIHDGKEISCVACGSHFEIVVQKVETTKQAGIINHCVPVNGVHAPFCTGHEKRAEHEHDYLNSIYCSICGQCEF